MGDGGEIGCRRAGAQGRHRHAAAAKFVRDCFAKTQHIGLGRAINGHVRAPSQKGVMHISIDDSICGLCNAKTESIFPHGGREVMVIHMDSKKPPPVNGIEPVLAEIQQRLQGHPKEWLKACKKTRVRSPTWKKKSITPSSRWPLASWPGCWLKQPRLPSSPVQP